jgi:hypothetical protein
MIAQSAQEAGQGALDFTRRSINDAAEPYYAALGSQTIPDAEYASMASDPAYRVTLRSVRQDPVLNGPLSSLPDNNLSVVNAVMKQLDRNRTASAQTALNPGGNNERAAAFGSIRQRADALASAVSGDWRAARGTVAAGRAQFLDPLEAGPVGKIAATNDLSAQTGALYPQNPPTGAPLETSEAVAALNTQDPDIAAALTRQHLGNTFNQSSRSLSSGPNQYGGALYARNLLGNSEQAATLRAGLDAIDPSGRLSDRLSTLADILQATGRRERPGSLTAHNAEDLKALALPPAPVRILGDLGNPFEWMQHISQGIGAQMFKKNMDALAAALTDPDLDAVLARAKAAQSPGSMGNLPIVAQSSQQQGASQ